MDAVTWAGMIFGGIIVLVTLGVVIKKGFDKWPVIAMGIGAFLLVGSKYASFKVSEGGIEVRRDVAAIAAATDEVAAQTQQAAAAVQVTQTQVANLVTLLERRNLLPPNATSPIRLQLDATPRIDLTKLKNARATVARIRNP
jgi:hypothetical protein